jgi:hypothetical protein
MLPTSTDHRAGCGRQGNHVLKSRANDAWRQRHPGIDGVGNLARDAGRKQEHAAILDRGIGQRDPRRDFRRPGETLDRNAGKIDSNHVRRL